MVRWCVVLGVVLLLTGSTVSSMVWSQRVLVREAEEVRSFRVQKQALEQQAALLRKPGNSPRLATLEEGMDTLRIRLVELMDQQPMPAGVLELTYQQSLLPRSLSDASDDIVRVLRLELTLNLQHAVALLNMLERVHESIITWPYETRACALHRISQRQLHAQCILDFYHWSRAESHDDTHLQVRVSEAVERL